MEKIKSFQINHLLLNPGIYVSRKDKAGDAVLTTFDIRMTKPNFEPVMNTAEIHTIEHLTFFFQSDTITDKDCRESAAIHNNYGKRIKSREV